MAAKPASAIARKHSVAAVDQKRLERAVHTPKHTAITRFHHPGTPVSPLASTPSMLDRSVPVIPVTPPPVHLAKTPQSAGGARAGQHQLASHDMPLRPNIFEQAMHRATSHQEPAHKVKRKRHRRLANSLAGVAAFLVIAGFISYLNMPALELKVASVQAGFRAALPDYQPTGYALAGGVKRNGGTVSMSFRSGASMYTITQQASDWNSQTLLDSTLGLGGEHAAVQKDGRTIYIYDDGANAAWVSGGVRYDLAANTELNKHDIVSIATSL
jgi:hypothetical protein